MATLQCEFCGGKLITKAGGICECDSCGMEFDKTWVKEKIQEIKGTVKVEGTVQVAGTVKIDGPVEVKGGVSGESLLRRGQLALEDKNWKTASEYFEKTLDINPESAEAYFGLAMCEAKVRSQEELVQRHQWENINYRRGKQFAEDTLLKRIESYEHSLIVQLEREKQERIAHEKQEQEKRIQLKKKNEYTHASNVMSSAGSYDKFLEAADIYTSLGDYLDSAEKAVECRERGWQMKAELEARQRKQRREAIYSQQQRVLQESNDIEILLIAAENLERLDDYKDCRELARQCREKTARITAEQKECERMETHKKVWQAKWRGAGVCHHCGGTLKGLFSKKCSVCGKPKDY